MIGFGAPLRAMFLAAVGLFLVLPLIVIGGISLNAERAFHFPPRGVSVRWYGEMLTDAGWLGAMTTSATVAVLAATLACSVALPVAYAMWRRPTLFVRLLFGACVLPFIVPPVVVALGNVTWWTQLGFYGQPIALVASHAMFVVTLPLLTLTIGLASIDRALVEAAESLGAHGSGLFRTVTWPLLRPYMITGFVFALVVSLNEYIIAYMVAGATVETVPVKVYNALRYGYSPVLAAVAVTFVTISFLCFGLIGRFGDLRRLMGAWRT